MANPRPKKGPKPGGGRGFAGDTHGFAEKRPSKRWTPLEERQRAYHDDGRVGVIDGNDLVVMEPSDRRGERLPFSSEWRIPFDV
jgi:hypothetical protein